MTNFEMLLGYLHDSGKDATQASATLPMGFFQSHHLFLPGSLQVALQCSSHRTLEETQELSSFSLVVDMVLPLTQCIREKDFFPSFLLQSSRS